VSKIESILGKKAIRALGIAESFVLQYPKSILCGVVCRSDGIVDGVVVDTCTVGGDDATESIIRMFRRLGRNDIHFLMIDGCIISWYNIVDLKRIYEEVKLPIISITFEDIEGDVESAIRKLFPKEVAEKKLSMFRNLPNPLKIYVRDGYHIYVRVVGIQESSRLIRSIVSRFIHEGKRPEPIRIAKLIANSILRVVLESRLSR